MMDWLSEVRRKLDAGEIEDVDLLSDGQCEVICELLALRDGNGLSEEVINRLCDRVGSSEFVKLTEAVYDGQPMASLADLAVKQFACKWQGTEDDAMPSTSELAQWLGEDFNQDDLRDVHLRLSTEFREHLWHLAHDKQTLNSLSPDTTVQYSAMTTAAMAARSPKIVIERHERFLELQQGGAEFGELDTQLASQLWELVSYGQVAPEQLPAYYPSYEVDVLQQALEAAEMYCS